jgi:hypothetical protein
MEDRTLRKIEQVFSIYIKLLFDFLSISLFPKKRRAYLDSSNNGNNSYNKCSQYGKKSCYYRKYNLLKELTACQKDFHFHPVGWLGFSFLV